MAKVVALSDRKKKLPDNVLRKVPTHPRNQEVRSREYLLEDEVDALIKAAGRVVGRHRLRDRTIQ